MPSRMLRRNRAALRNPASRLNSSRDVTSLDYYAIGDLLTDDERAARDRAQRFVQGEVMSKTVVPFHRAGKFPEHLIARTGVN